MFRKHFQFLFFLLVVAGAMAQNPKWKKWEVEADTLMNRQEFEKAINLYSKVIKTSKLNDKSAYSAVYKRAVCYYSVGNYQAAVNDADTFLEEQPSLFQAHLLKAFIYRDMGDEENQLDALNQALAIQPGDPG
ncbi:MAG: tetratricopeptide repeat protein, partial [Cyclobacteriaceae bacterium]